MTDQFQVKDSGVREEYASGMRRDTQDGKPDYTLIDREGLRRYAQHLTLGAEKYGRDNWRLANSQEELDRFRSSAMRHLMQWLNGDRDEDHASAVKFNLDAAEYVAKRLIAAGLTATEPAGKTHKFRANSMLPDLCTFCAKPAWSTSHEAASVE